MTQRVKNKRERMRLFYEKIMPVTESGCWIWVASLRSRGYGQFFMGGRRAIEAHRASWILHNGNIPPGLRVLHKCDVEPCVNPDHLFLGTARDNTQDMISKGRHRYATWNAPKGENHWRNRRKENARI